MHYNDRIPNVPYSLQITHLKTSPSHSAIMRIDLNIPLPLGQRRAMATQSQGPEPASGPSDQKSDLISLHPDDPKTDNGARKALNFAYEELKKMHTKVDKLEADHITQYKNHEEQIRKTRKDVLDAQRAVADVQEPREPLTSKEYTALTKAGLEPHFASKAEFDAMQAKMNEMAEKLGVLQKPRGRTTVDPALQAKVDGAEERMARLKSGVASLNERIDNVKSSDSIYQLALAGLGTVVVGLLGYLFWREFSVKKKPDEGKNGEKGVKEKGKEGEKEKGSDGGKEKAKPEGAPRLHARDFLWRDEELNTIAKF